MTGTLERLAATLRAGGGLLADTVDGPDPRPDERLGAAVAARGADYALLVEAIREGELLHYASGRVVRPADPDLALLAGDRLYALGLARLADLGDVDAVAVLADVISACAQAHAEGRPAAAQEAWEAGVRAIAGAAER